MAATVRKERFRHELKIILPAEKIESFKESIAPWCDVDAHAGPLGCYEVGSLYYDTPDLRFFWDREESVGYRRKVRLRSYNHDGKATKLFVEIKEKHLQLCAKKRIDLPDTSLLETTDRHDRLPLNDVLDAMEESAEKREVAYLHERLRLTPVVIVRYIRAPFIPKYEGDARITIDSRITAGGENLGFYDTRKESFVLSPSRSILEIKTNGGLPLWLQSVLRRHELWQSKYSKYCEAVRTYWGPKHYFLPVDSDSVKPLLPTEEVPHRRAVGDI